MCRICPGKWWWSEIRFAGRLKNGSGTEGFTLFHAWRFRLIFFSKAGCVQNEADVEITNYRLLFLYAAPYVVYVAIGALDSFLSMAWIYGLRLLIVPGVILWAWRWYIPLKGPRNPAVSIFSGILVGIAGTAVWVSLLTPFVTASAVPWDTHAFYLRGAASGFVVPVFEELFMRGFVFLFVLQWDAARKRGIKDALGVTLHESTVNDVPGFYWNGLAILLSTVVFTVGHQSSQWPASFAYGLMMALLLITRKDLLSCVVAHGTTNFCLAVYVRFTGNWEYW